MKCFYHADLDGKASAFCVHAWVGIHNIETHDISNCMVKMDYNKPFPFDIVKHNEQIWIVDFSISPDEMRKLLTITNDVTWIDHHKTSIDKYKNFEHNIKGIRKNGEAGCVLTYKYIHWWSSRGDEPFDFDRDFSLAFPVPRMIELIGDMDVWTWKYGNETKYFCTGAKLHNTSPDSNFWWKCMEHEIEDIPNTGNKEAREKGEKYWNRILRDGKLIDIYLNRGDNDINKDLGFECNFEGLNCWAVNRPRCGSKRFEKQYNTYDAVMSFFYNGENYTVSVYSKERDVSNIAKKYGGGGHKNASGFICKKLPFKKRI